MSKSRKGSNCSTDGSDKSIAREPAGPIVSSVRGGITTVGRTTVTLKRTPTKKSTTRSTSLEDCHSRIQSPRSVTGDNQTAEIDSGRQIPKRKVFLKTNTHNLINTSVSRGVTHKVADYSVNIASFKKPVRRGSEGQDNLVPLDSDDRLRVRTRMAAGAAVQSIHEIRNLVKIKDLNLDMQDSTIVGRCVRLTPPRKIKSFNGNSQVMDFDLTDSDNGVVRCICFGHLVSEIEQDVTKGKIYSLSGFNLKLKSKYNNLDHSYEVHLKSQSEIYEINEEEIDFMIPQFNWNFVDVQRIDQYAKGTQIDYIGVVCSVTDTSVVYSPQKGRILHVCSLVMIDQTRLRIEVKMWDTLAKTFGKQLREKCNTTGRFVLALKTLTVSPYHRYELTAMECTSFEIQPNIEQATQLNEMRNLFTLDLKSFSKVPIIGSDNIVPISSIQDRQLLITERFDDCVIGKIQTMDLKHLFSYSCTKQVGDQECGRYLREKEAEFYCSSCDEVVEYGNIKYNIVMEIKDESGSMIVNVYDLGRELMMDMLPSELKDIEHTKAYHEIIAEVMNQKYLFFIQTKMCYVGSELVAKSTAYEFDIVV
eukprot:g3374.t1